MVFNQERFKELKAISPNQSFKETSQQVCKEYRELTDSQKASLQQRCDQVNKDRDVEHEKVLAEFNEKNPLNKSNQSS